MCPCIMYIWHSSDGIVFVFSQYSMYLCMLSTARPQGPASKLKKKCQQIHLDSLFSQVIYPGRDTPSLAPVQSATVCMCTLQQWLKQIFNLEDSWSLSVMAMLRRRQKVMNCRKRRKTNSEQ